MAYRDYAPKKVNVSWGGVILEGFAPDTFISVTANSGLTTEYVGADGKLGLNINADETATVELTLAQGAESNQILAGTYNLQKTRQEIFRPDMTIIDRSGGFLCKLFNVSIKTPPPQTLAGERGDRTWTFIAEQMIWVEVPEGFLSEGANAAAELSRIADSISTIEELGNIFNTD